MVSKYTSMADTLVAHRVAMGCSQQALQQLMEDYFK